MREEKVHVLFLCNANAARSPIAEGWLHFLAENRLVALSAGINPQPVAKLAVEVMQEVGIDISQHVSRSMEDHVRQAPDVVIDLTKEGFFREQFVRSAQHYEHWPIDDPAMATSRERGAWLNAFRTLRDDIGVRVRELLARLRIADS